MTAAPRRAAPASANAAASAPPADAPPPAGSAVRRRSRRMAGAVVFSTLFHLSMVTLFRIVVYFPEPEVTYYTMDIIPVAASAAGASAGAPQGGLRLGGSELAQAFTAPEVRLPALDFAELERLRVSGIGAGDDALMDKVFGVQEPRDSWGRFSRGLQRFGESIGDLAWPWDGEGAAGEPKPAAAHRPAVGFEGYVVWNSAPPDRELLFAPPIEALWKAGPEALARPLELVITVNPAGRVVNVWSPTVEGGELTDAVQMAVLNYRFAPLGEGPDGAPAREQMGALYIRAAEDRP